jgi:hypothetical protein
VKGLSPAFVTQWYRFIRYRNHRRKVLREPAVRRKQDEWLAQSFDLSGKKLIVFLVPGCDIVTGKDNISGGVISIVSLCEETKALESEHKGQTIMCTLSGDHLFLKHEMFENSTRVYRLGQLLNFKSIDDLIVHVPEFMVKDFVSGLRPDERRYIDGIQKVHVNVMNQNILLMPDPPELKILEPISDLITITTAHQKYCTRERSLFYGRPLHKFSVWISPEQYNYVEWRKKENLIVVSPDLHPQKEEVMEVLRTIPGLEVVVIKGLTYQAYKELISRAKWSLTFGEGLDGYFIEPVFSGAVSFAVFNDEFFTPDFRDLRGVFSSMEKLRASIRDTIGELDRPENFSSAQKQQYLLCAKYYSKEVYKKNVLDFYNGVYTYS